MAFVNGMQPSFSGVGGIKPWFLRSATPRAEDARTEKTGRLRSE